MQDLLRQLGRRKSLLRFNSPNGIEGVTRHNRRYGHPLHITKTHLFKYIENVTTKSRKFSDRNSDIFFSISAQNIDCGYSLEPPRRGGSNEYPQSMFLSRNKKNNVYPCKPQFYYIKVGFKGVKIIKVCFRDEPGFAPDVLALSCFLIHLGQDEGVRLILCSSPSL